MPPVLREELTPALGAVPIGDRPRLSPDFYQQNQHNGMSQQWNLGIQRDLGANTLAEITYIGNVGHQLGGANVNLNMIPLVNGRGPARQRQVDKPFPQFQNVFQESPAWGNSTYHSMNIKLEKRYSGGLNFLINYTFSKFIDDVEAAAELGGEQGQWLSAPRTAASRQVAGGNDIRNRLISSMVYELPFGRGRHFTIEIAL